MATIQSDDAKSFSRLFRGYENAYGQYDLKNTKGDGKILGAAQTIARPPTIEDYSRHLSGELGMGVIPLLKDDVCWFGAIDIDIKGEVKLTEDHFILEARIRKYQLPLVMCRSKSNGAHLYLFAKDKPISARLMQSRMKEFSTLLGYGGAEIFPKQIMRLKDTDFGNWINLPYFNKTRQCIHEGKQLETFAEFAAVADYMAINEKPLRAFHISMGDEFSDGPFCLQQMCTIGFTEGSRNNSLFNVAIYMRKKFPDDWQDKLSEFNEKHMQPPLPHGELQVVVKSIIKKEYNYTCKQPPIVSHCNRKECLKREFGVGDSDEGHTRLPITSLVKYISKNSVRWGANTEAAMLEFSTDELFSFEAHRKKLAEALNIVVLNIKSDNFIKQMSELVEHSEIIYDPEDASETGQLIQNIKSWFYTKRSAKNPDEMIKGMWWLNDETGKIYFQWEGMKHFLQNEKKMNNIKDHAAFRLLNKEFGAEQDRLLIKGVRKRVWVIPHFEFENQDPLQAPTVDKAQEAM